MVKDYPINSIEVARLRDENYTLEQRNAALSSALAELLESTNDVLDATSLVDPAVRLFRVTASVVNARQALAQVGE